MSSAGEPRDNEAYLTVAVSGGGYRAALFGLGAFAFMVDSGLNRRVRLVSSVSGGSLLNAFIAQECDLAQVSSRGFDETASKLLDTIIHRSIVASWAVRAYIVGLLGASVLIAAICIAGTPFQLPVWLCIAALVGVATALLLRGVVVEARMGTTLYTTADGPTRLGSLQSGVVHVFCTTDLAYGAPFFFMTSDRGAFQVAAEYQTYRRLRRIVGPKPRSHQWPADDVKLKKAVRASAAFPGAIPPRRHRPAPKEPTRFLADGGVWNNLGTQLFDHAKELRFLVESDLEKEFDDLFAGRLIVINASAPLDQTSRIPLRVPIVAELMGIVRSMRLLYENSVGPRVSSIRAEAGGRHSAAPIIVDIKDATWFVSGGFAWATEETHWAEWRRVYEVQRTLAPALSWRDAGYWIPTTFGRLSQQKALTLLLEGYAGAMFKLHESGECALIEVTEERFSRLLSG